MTALIRPISSKFWDLRRAWATGKRVALSLERCDRDRVEGIVTHVSATDALVRVGGITVPGECVLAVHNPSLLGDSTADPYQPLHGPPRRWRPQSEELPGVGA